MHNYLKTISALNFDEGCYFQELNEVIKPTDSALLLEAHVHPSPPPGVCRTQLQDGDVTNVSFLAEGGVLLFVD